jgi:hypothetical protein
MLGTQSLMPRVLFSIRRRRWIPLSPVQRSDENCSQKDLGTRVGSAGDSS